MKKGLCDICFTWTFFFFFEENTISLQWHTFIDRYANLPVYVENIARGNRFLVKKFHRSIERLGSTNCMIHIANIRIYTYIYIYIYIYACTC